MTTPEKIYVKIILSLNVEAIDPASSFECNESLLHNLTVEELLTSEVLNYPSFSSNYLLLFEKFVLNIKQEIFISTADDLMRMWSPLEENIFRFVMYCEDNMANNISRIIKKHYTGQTLRDFNVRNFEIATYIPDQQLRSLSEENKEKIHAVLIFITKNSKFKRILYEPVNTAIVGVGIPGFYKRNNLALLEAYLDGRRTQYGKNSYDIFKSPNYTSVLSNILYFSWKETDIFKKVGPSLAPSTSSTSPVESGMARRTEEILRKVYYCLSFCSEDFCFSVNDVTNLTKDKSDKYLRVKSYERLTENCYHFESNVSVALLTRSLELIVSQTQQTHQMTYVTTYFGYYKYHFLEDEYINKKLTYFNIINIGVSSEFVLHYLHGTDDNSIDDKYFYQVYIVIFNTKEISEVGKYVCKGRVLDMYLDSWCSSTFKMYLKIIDFWFNVIIDPTSYTLFCFSEPPDNICNDGSKIFVYSYRIPETIEIDHVKNAVPVRTDILSLLSSSVSPTSKPANHQQFELRKVRTSISILEIIIILSWCKNRMCTFLLSLVA